MKALRIKKYGKADVLSLRDIPTPEPGKKQVLVEVHAASINPRDWLLQEGRYQFKFAIGKPPLTLGSDFSGRVLAIGPGVTRFKPGDEVFGLSWKMGAFSEAVVVGDTSISQKPANVSHADAAAIPCAGQTALRALAGLKPGSRVVVNGAAGGVGSFAVQFAKVLGCHVVAVASGKNEAFCKEIGADEFINYETTDFTKAIAGQDMVLDAVGRSSYKKCKRVMTRNGMYVTPIPSIPHVMQSLRMWAASGFGLLRGRRIRLVFSVTKVEQLDRIAVWCAGGSVKIPVSATYDFDDIADALAESKTWHTRGKLVVQIAPAASRFKAV